MLVAMLRGLARIQAVSADAVETRQPLAMTVGSAASFHHTLKAHQQNSDSRVTPLHQTDLKTHFPELSGLILALETPRGFCCAIPCVLPQSERPGEAHRAHSILLPLGVEQADQPSEVTAKLSRFIDCTANCLPSRKLLHDG